jgi:uncharacterized protein
MITRRPLLFVLVGPVGTGKSSLAARLADDLGCTVVANDEVRERLFASPAYGDEENRTVYAVALDLVESALAAGHDVVYDGTNLGSDVRERVRRRVDPVADVLFLLTCASDVTCRDRLAGRVGGADHWWAVYQDLCSRMQPLEWSFVLADLSTPGDTLVPLLRRLIAS